MVLMQEHGMHKGLLTPTIYPRNSLYPCHEHGMHKGLLTPTIYPQNPLYPCYGTEGTYTRQSRDRIHGTHKGRPDADKIPVKAMHGTHKGRLTPTIYPRKPCMERTRVC
ncbi:hypothetical protein EV363DRAFT_1393317 [Boletus edulis]|nr:hypothetical protein EV363DRAFT_1393317 [Boletus edulis]